MVYEIRAMTYCFDGARVLLLLVVIYTVGFVTDGASGGGGLEEVVVIHVSGTSYARDSTVAAGTDKIIFPRPIRSPAWSRTPVAPKSLAAGQRIYRPGMPQRQSHAKRVLHTLCWLSSSGRVDCRGVQLYA